MIESGDLFGPTNALWRAMGPGAPSLKTELSYDPFGRIQAVQHSTGMAGTYTYDGMGRVTDISWNQEEGHFGRALPFTSERLLQQAIDLGNAVIP